MKFKKLSTTLWQLKKWFMYDSRLWKIPVADVIVAPALGTNTAVHAAITLPATWTTEVTTAITNPATPRNLVIKGNAAGIAAAVTIVWLDISGQKVTETLTGSGASAVAWSVIFSVVNSITVWALTTAWDTISVGTGAKLGLKRPITDAADVKLLTIDGTAEAPASVDTTWHSFTATTALNGSKNVYVYYDATVI